MTLGDGVTVPRSYLDGARVEDGAHVGPFAYLRPGTVLREGAKAGTFVEIKNSDDRRRLEGPAPLLHRRRRRRRGHATSAPATSPPTTTAATSTARRSATACTASVDTTFVAPVTVGDDAWTAAGSVITEDVPPGALGIARERQTQHRGLRGARLPEAAVRRGEPSAPRRTLRNEMSALHPASQPATSLEIGYDKRLMLVSRPRATRSSPHASPASSASSSARVTLKTFSNGEVYCRYEESIRGADVFIVQPTCGNPRTGSPPTTR